MNYLDLRRDSLQESYWLETDGVSLSIVVTPVIHEHVATSLAASPPLVGGLAKKYGLSEFILPVDSAWGYGGVVRFRTEDGGVRHTVALPSGDSNANTAAAAMAIRATLYVFLMLLSMYPQERTAGNGQILTVDSLELGYGFGQGSLNATLGQGVVYWISRQQQTHRHAELSDILLTAHRHMTGRASSYNDSIRRVEIEPPRYITVHCDTENRQSVVDGGKQSSLANSKEGYSIYTHNFDSYLEQFMLLVCLARLCQLVRASR